MARQNLDRGTTANDGTGDTLRSAALKINDNFVELYRFLGGGDSNNLSAQVSLEDSAVVFEGASVDAFETRLVASNVGADVKITLPDSNGVVTLNEAVQTLTNKTLTSPAITTPSITTSINDANGNESIKLTATGSAVNEITVINSASTNAVQVNATGTATNLNLNLNAKGTGSIEMSKAAFEAVEITANGAASAAATLIICNKGSALAVSLADGTTTGEYKIFTNKGAGVATITPSNFAAGTSFAIAQNEGATCIWDGTNWFLVGNQSVTTVA
jgi:hypothetical protein|tara:strand:- start:503 stop:1324 length:822 start_codon:yes stop_codon:yes gene_type:complete